MKIITTILGIIGFTTLIFIFLIWIKYSLKLGMRIFDKILK